MLIQWAIEKGMDYWSDINFTFDGKTYSSVITPGSFDTLNCYQKDTTKFSFSLVDPPTVAYLRDDLINQTIILRLIIDGVQSRAWKLKIYSAVYAYGVWECKTKGLLGEVLTGMYPKTQKATALFPSDMVLSGDVAEYVAPVVFGTAYIPVAPVLTTLSFPVTGLGVGYVIGKDGPTYTIEELLTPHDYPGSIIYDNTYTYSQDTANGMRIVQPVLQDVSGDGTPDAPGIFESGGVLAPLLRYSTSGPDGTNALTSPEQVVELVLEGMGVAVGDIDTGVSFLAAGLVYVGRSIIYNGGFWIQESCQSAIDALLEPCDSYLYEGEKIELHPFVSDSVGTFTNADVEDETFSINPRTVQENDGGTVEWPMPGKAQDVFNGQATVGCYDSQVEITNPGKTVTIRFMTDSVNSKTAGMLSLAKEYLIEDDVSFGTTYENITNIDTIKPNNVVMINDDMFGAFFIIIESINFKQWTVEISGVRLKALEDWDDIVSNFANVVKTLSVIGGTAIGGVNSSVAIENYSQVGFSVEDFGDPANWSEIIDDDANKPEDGADVTQDAIDGGIATIGHLQSVDYDANNGMQIDFNNAKITVNEAGGLTITAADGVTLEAGADILMKAADGNPSLMKWITANRTITMKSEFAQDSLCIYPDANNVGDLYLGSDETWLQNAQFHLIGAFAKNVMIWADDQVRLAAGDAYSTFGEHTELWVVGPAVRIHDYGSDLGDGYAGNLEADGYIEAGRGLKPSTTADTIDDYEKGIYTATITPETSGSVTLDTSYDTLAYTKIGQQVTVQGRLLLSSVSSPVGTVEISLPFMVEGKTENSDYSVGSVISSYLNFDAGFTQINPCTFGGKNTFQIRESGDNQAYKIYGSGATFTGNEYLIINISYIAE